MLKTLPPGVHDTLFWLPELGYGYHTRPPIDYDGDYWDEYVRRDASAMGEQLTLARQSFVRGFWEGEVVDIGIGGGRFVTDADAYGYDINPRAVDWLHTHGRYRDPYAAPVDAITCWDSLEHIPDPDALLAQVQRWLFVSLPIFSDAEHCIHSRHYKPGEHIWYFTHGGIIQWCNDRGFELVSSTDVESRLGRDGIRSYAFRRM